MPSTLPPSALSGERRELTQLLPPAGSLRGGAAREVEETRDWPDWLTCAAPLSPAPGAAGLRARGREPPQGSGARPRGRGRKAWLARLTEARGSAPPSARELWDSARARGRNPSQQSGALRNELKTSNRFREGRAFIHGFPSLLSPCFAFPSCFLVFVCLWRTPENAPPVLLAPVSPFSALPLRLPGTQSRAAGCVLNLQLVNSKGRDHERAARGSMACWQSNTLAVSESPRGCSWALL